MKKFAIYKTELGFLRMEYDGDSIVYIGKENGAPECNGEKNALTDKAYIQLTEYLKGERKKFDFKYKLNGTEFQMKVWRALCDIPYGETRTYKQIAATVGNPKACRAVGMANNKSPIAIVVPCHRVVGSNGKLVGYAGGIEMKKILLDLEAKYTEPKI